MALQIEQISATQIWIHDGATNIMEIDTADGVRINSALKIGTDLISPSASELAAINGLTASAAELNYNDITTLGTLAASKTWSSNASLDTIMPTGGNFTVQSGGDVTLESGSTLDVAGTFEIANVAMTRSAAQINLLTQGVAGDYKIARSAAPLALDGSNPTSFAHGLTTCLSVNVSLNGSAAPGVGTSHITKVINGANVDVYAWKVTSTTDNTLIASTGTETFDWQAIGT